MAIERLKRDFSIDQERVKLLEQIVPEAFADGEINWENLKEALGEYLEEESPDAEHFGLSWAGKREARKLSSLPSQGTLVPVLGEGVNEENTSNFFIEGDNLEVLKLLCKSYAERVKLIYIDPPYNTGNDLLYKDNFNDSLADYLQKTGQQDEEGNLLTTNPKASGRFHSNWLNMMYPRLRIAKDLLKKDGVIFVSIGDDEVANLRLLLNDVFGEENFVNIISVKAKPSAGASGGGEDKRLKKNIEFLLVYARDREGNQDALNFAEAFEKTDLFEHIQHMKEEEKSWKYTRVLVSSGSREYVKTIQDGSGQDIFLYRHRDFVMESIATLAEKEVEVSNIKDETVDIFDQRLAKTYCKYFSKVFRDTNAQSSIRARVMSALPEDGLFSIDYTPKSGRSKGKLTTVYYKGLNKDQIAWLSDVAEMNGDQIILKEKIGTLWDGFNWNNVSKEGDTPFPNGKKPIALIKQLLALSTSPSEEDIVLDFFAGSGSTAHACLDKNKEDGGNRKFILVQIPEIVKTKTSEDSIPPLVSEICKDRLRRVISKEVIQNDNKLPFEETVSLDYGFRVLKLAESNFRRWKDYHGEDIQELQTTFLDLESPLVEGWQELSVVLEILLIERFPLDSRISHQSQFESNQVLMAESNCVAHRLFLCLDENIDDQTIQQLPLPQSEDVFICLDSALTDEAKLQLADTCNIKTI